MGLSRHEAPLGSPVQRRGAGLVGRGARGWGDADGCPVAVGCRGVGDGGWVLVLGCMACGVNGTSGARLGGVGSDALWCKAGAGSP